MLLTNKKRNVQFSSMKIGLYCNTCIELKVVLRSYYFVIVIGVNSFHFLLWFVKYLCEIITHKGVLCLPYS